MFLIFVIQTGDMDYKELSKKEYRARINRVMDYMEKNIDRTLDLSQMADIAHFSPYHFHRIFTSITGETPKHFLQRIRIEKSARLLHDNPKISISEIAGICGFSTAALFSRTFRKFFGITAKEYRKSLKPIYVKEAIYYNKNGQAVSKKRQSRTEHFPQFCRVELTNMIMMNTTIEIKSMPEMKVIYYRHSGEFQKIKHAYEKLAKWAAPRGLLDNPEAKTLTVYHDDPSVTSMENVRQSACLVVGEDVKGEGEIGTMTVPGGKFAVGHFEINPEEFEQAWNTMCHWLSESGYQPGDANPYELYHHPNPGSGKYFSVDICIPIKPL